MVSEAGCQEAIGVVPSVWAAGPQGQVVLCVRDHSDEAIVSGHPGMEGVHPPVFSLCAELNQLAPASHLPRTHEI